MSIFYDYFDSENQIHIFNHVPIPCRILFPSSLLAVDTPLTAHSIWLDVAQIQDEIIREIEVEIIRKTIHTGCEVCDPLWGENDEARVVANQVQAAELLVRCPSDPLIPRGQLEGSRLPAYQCQLGFAVQRDMAQTLAEDAAGAQIVMFLDQAVPHPVLGSATGRADPHRAQVDGRLQCRKTCHGLHPTGGKTEWSVQNSLCWTDRDHIS